jgi:hypothetical protein
MKSTLKASFTAIMMTSVAIGAVATIGTLSSADAAYAKSENSGKKSEKSRGRSSEARENKGRSGEKSASRDTSSGGAEALFRKLIGQEKKAAKPSASSERAQPAQASKSKKADRTFHPSQLGNMNGAMNANINAVLAHIRNGNGSGPVGHVAAWVAAATRPESDQLILNRVALFNALDSSDDYKSVEEYYTALEGGAESDDSIDTALMALGYDVTNWGDAPANLALDPADPFASGANESLVAEKEAERRLLAYWNKNPGGDVNDGTALTDAEEGLLVELRARFSEADLAAIKDALPEEETGVSDDEDACDGLDEACEEDDLASL